MRIRLFALAGLFTFSLTVVSLPAQENGWQSPLLVYSPRYFGPSAFPIPQLRFGQVGNQYELEARGQYHYYTGDRTTDLFTRALLPFVKGRAGLEVSFLVVEKYKTTDATRKERHAIENECPPNAGYCGDVVVSAFFSLLRNPRFCDALFNFGLKTASGGRLCDARFTDAASYWFDLDLGRDLLRSADGSRALRLGALAGFYCWMTNSGVDRQNDAFLFGGGLSGRLGRFSLRSDLAGFSGYRDDGDHPLVWRNNFRFEFRKNVLSLCYDHGMKDNLYDTYSIGYIRRF
jgi:hypothetical protein